MIPGRAACKVTQVGSLTEKWHFHGKMKGKSPLKFLVFNPIYSKESCLDLDKRTSHIL
jgi:hypothetical protein